MPSSTHCVVPAPGAATVSGFSRQEKLRVHATWSPFFLGVQVKNILTLSFYNIAQRYVSVDSGGRKSSVDESGESTVSLGMKAKAYANKRSNINARYDFCDIDTPRVKLLPCIF